MEEGKRNRRRQKKRSRRRKKMKKYKRNLYRNRLKIRRNSQKYNSRKVLYLKINIYGIIRFILMYSKSTVHTVLLLFKLVVRYNLIPHQTLSCPPSKTLINIYT